MALRIGRSKRQVDNQHGPGVEDSILILDPWSVRACAEELRTWEFVDVPTIWLTPLFQGEIALPRMRANLRVSPVVENSGYVGEWHCEHTVSLDGLLIEMSSSGTHTEYIIPKPVVCSAGAILTYELSVRPVT